MKLLAALVTTILLTAATARADVYLQYPRGSNNGGTSTQTTSSDTSSGSSFIDWLVSLF